MIDFGNLEGDWASWANWYPKAASSLQGIPAEYIPPGDEKCSLLDKRAKSAEIQANIETKSCNGCFAAL